MFARFFGALMMSVVLAVSLGAVASAHDDGKGAVHSPSMEAQEWEFENVAGGRANEKGNAPRGHAPCINGMAAKTFPCDGVDMMSHLTRADLGLSFVNDIWGWTDTQTGDEYAMVGGIEGTVFVNITDAKRPQVLGILPTHSTEGGDVWRDIKVHANHAYVVSEHTDHGMQVFDLTQLRGQDAGDRVFEETAHYGEFGSAHNLNINEDSGFAYVVGSGTCDGGLHMIDITDPASPAAAGCYSESGYIHDTQCVTYQGPDATYQGREICFNSNAENTPAGLENTLTISDVTDKANPVTLSRVFYDNDGYSHQGWLTPDQGYFLHGDELDEQRRGINTTTRVWDVQDLENPAVIGNHDNGTTSIDHNIYTKGDRAFASNYTSGLRIFDTANVADGTLSEVGFFDVYPENDNATFEGGTWSNYPYYTQNVVAVASIERGLFLLKPRGNVGG
ncbi:choice-of-anchor B family protein [Arthrobacter sp. H5]|uniref:choice-of-anchor B family protein n=1 Tax=Arthrobacter sp. H5 TaxID=1267973 RepID=UPI0004AFA41A|nr:choice-of-anchor B family protein [Arthrobacter sp. H5]